MSRQIKDPISGSWVTTAGYNAIDNALDPNSRNPVENRVITERINNVIRYPNFTTVLKTFSGGSVESYTPTVDAWVIGNVKAPASDAGYVNINNRTVAWTNSYCGVCVPVKAGVTISVYTDSSQKPVVYASY